MKPISIHHLFSEIESDYFYGNIALLNDLNSFLIFVKSNSATLELTNIIKLDLENLKLLKDRIMKLLNLNCDKNKIHPYDHVIAIYLYVVYSTSMIEVESILELIYKKKPRNLYWTYWIYNYILKSLPKVINCYCDTYQLTETPELEPIDIEASNSNKTKQEY